MKPLIVLFFLYFFACKNTESDKSTTSYLNLAGKKFSYNTDVSYINTTICEFSCECDCGMGDFIFNVDGTCYFSDFCCCGNPETYYKGKYRISGAEVMKEYVLEYDAATTKMNEEGISPINPISILAESKAFTYRFQAGYCPQGQMYLYDENTNKTYLRIKAAIAPQDIRYSKAVDTLLKTINY